ncbi:MAG: Spy/CpxP family protein refolding chaperone [Synechocystis sp.]|nr:Spy/CpxP family protein refolding chaperone [Synechocystis sp.]
MKNLILLGLFTSLAVTSVAFPSAAENAITEFPQLLSQRGPNPQREDRLMESLNLNDQQKQDLNKIRQKYQSQMDTIVSQLRSRQDELRTLMSSNASDDAIRAKHNQVSELRQQLGDLRFESMLESRKVLTPDQRKQFAQLMDERRSRKPYPGRGQSN